MITENAFVDAVEGDAAWVQTQRQSACGSCGAQNACGTNVLSKVIGTKFARLRVGNPLHARPGDQVQVAIAEQVLLKGAAVVYLLPLFAFFVMAAIGTTLSETHKDLASIAMGVVGLVVGLAWAQRYERVHQSKCGFHAEIVAIDNTATDKATTVQYVQFKKLSSGE